MSRRWRAGGLALTAAVVGPWLVLAPTATADDGPDGLSGWIDEAFEAVDDDAPERDAKSGDRDRKRSEERAKKDSARTPAPGDTRRAEVVKTGWWWAANEPPPDTGLVAAPQPPAPNVPTGTVPVGAVLGEAEKIAAVELDLKAQAGSSVKRLVMVLRESAASGSNISSDTARILACPVTELFWADGQAAAWKNRPVHDCEDGTVGKRDDQGLWTFDLTPLASEWLAEGSTASRSVVLVEDVEAPESFQVVFDGPKLDGVGLELLATAPDPQDDGADDDPDPGPQPPVENGDSGLDSQGGKGDLGGQPVGGGPVADAPTGTEPVAAGAGEDMAVETAPAAFLPSWYDGIPRAGYLLLPLALGMAYLIMLALGPDARPVPISGRHGVSRALDRLRRTSLVARSSR